MAVEETTSWELMVRLYTYYVMTVAVLPTVGLTSMQALFDINNSEWASIYLPDKVLSPSDKTGLPFENYSAKKRLQSSSQRKSSQISKFC